MAYVVQAGVAKDSEKGLVLVDLTFGNRLPSTIQTSAAVLARYLENTEGELAPQEGECFEVRILVSRIEGVVSNDSSIVSMREQHSDCVRNAGFKPLDK